VGQRRRACRTCMRRHCARDIAIRQPEWIDQAVIVGAASPDVGVEIGEGRIVEGRGSTLGFQADRRYSGHFE